ncbi:MAG: ATP/GTP-binding protein [Anaerolineae bacterium]|nr:ATP/GTP-binding protein [Anaerolineae bacterium]
MSENSAANASPQAVKIVVDGARGCGKTTFVNALSELVPDASRSAESVAMDFGRVTVDDDLALYLFGMPGGRRYDFMWDVLKEGLLGFILLVDSAHPRTFRETQNILRIFLNYAPVLYIVAANFQDSPDAWRVDDLRFALRIPPEIGVVPCVGTDRESVKQVILALLEKVIETLDDPDETPDLP